MRVRAAAWVCLAVLVAAGCAPGISVRREGERPRDPAPLWQALQDYNAAPRAVRVQGRLAVHGRGSAQFGARAAAGLGLRLDAVAGPFGRPVLAVACRDAVGCQVLLPGKGQLLEEPDGVWGVWLGALLRGRVPLMGPPVGALERDGGRPVLVLDAPAPWRQEVEFDPAAGHPVRMLLWRGAEPRVEVRLDRFFPVEGQPFPGRVEVRTEEPRGGYEIEFRRVAVDEGEDVGVFRLTPPPGTRVLDVRGSAQWSETELPLWLPIPDG